MMPRPNVSTVANLTGSSRYVSAIRIARAVSDIGGLLLSAAAVAAACLGLQQAHTDGQQWRAPRQQRRQRGRQRGGRCEKTGTSWALGGL